MSEVGIKCQPHFQPKNLETYNYPEIKLRYGHIESVARSLEIDLIYWSDRSTPEELRLLRQQIKALCRDYLGRK